MNLSAVIDAMLAAGCSPEQMAAVVRAYELEREYAASAKRAKDAERQRKSRMSRGVTVTGCDSDGQKAPPLSPLSLSPTPPNPNPPISPQKQNNMAGARAELEKVLPPDLSQAVIDHRKAIRKPLTAHAAKLLAREFAKCEDPVSSAETMIQQGWQGFKADWSTEAIPRKAQYPHRENYVDVAKRLGWFDAEQDADDAFSNVEFLPAVNRGR